MMKNKLHINNINENDERLIRELLDLMHVHKLDYTNTFIDIEENNLMKYEFMKDWLLKLEDRKKLNNKNDNFNNINPRIIPRNHLIENLLKKSEKGDFDELNEWIIHLKNPFNKNIPQKYKELPKHEEKVYQTFCGT